MKACFYYILLVLLVTGCNKEEEENLVEPAGTKYAVSDRDIGEVHEALMQFFNENEGMQVMNEVNFQNSSGNADLDIDPVRTIFFGNPEMGTPLIQQDPLVALDLPQHLVLFEFKEKVFAMYNSTQYLQSRYELQEAPGLDKISGALESLVNSATASPIREAEEQEVERHKGIVTVVGERNFEQTQMNLKRALRQNENWRVISEIDHARNAYNAGMQLRPTLLFIISNPYLESSMLKENPTAGLDYPHKILIWEDTDSIVRISYNDPNYLQQRHQMIGTSIEIVETSTAFKAIVNYAATHIEDYDAPENTEMEFDEGSYR